MNAISDDQTNRRLVCVRITLSKRNSRAYRMRYDQKILTIWKEGKKWRKKKLLRSWLVRELVVKSWLRSWQSPRNQMRYNFVFFCVKCTRRRKKRFLSNIVRYLWFIVKSWIYTVSLDIDTPVGSIYVRFFVDI